MDVDKVVKFLSENLVEWSRVFVLTLASPTHRFDLVSNETPSLASIIGSTSPERNLWLSPKLIAFTVFSIVLGLSINGLIPCRHAGPDLPTSVVFIFFLWFFFGSVSHLFCRILGGRGNFLETLSISIQLQATLYVFTSFLALMVAILLPSEWILKTAPVIGKQLVDDPAMLFFSIGTLLSMVYLPLALRSVHKFGLLKTLAVAIFPLLTIWIPVAIYVRLGLMTNVFMSLLE